MFTLNVVKPQVYFIVNPEGFEGENFENYHVIKCADKGEPCIRRKKKSLCNKDRTDKMKSKHYEEVVGEDSLRLRLAEMQNEGKKICGTCVSMLYADNE